MSVYWIFFLLTWTAAGAFFAWQATRHCVPRMAVVDGLLLVLPALVVGGHLLSAVLGLGEVRDWRSFFFTVEGWRSGHVSFGALGGGLVALWVAARLHRLPGLLLIDLAMPALFLASALMRVGCFLTGCCFGAPTSMPWGVRFALDHPFQPWTPPSHPTQLYETAASLVFFAALPWLFRRIRSAPGQGTIALVCGLLFLAERFVIEFFRVGGTTVAVYHGFSEPHFVTLTGALLCALSLYLRRGPAELIQVRHGPRAGVHKGGIHATLPRLLRARPFPGGSGVLDRRSLPERGEGLPPLRRSPPEGGGAHGRHRRPPDAAAAAGAGDLAGGGLPVDRLLFTSAAV